MSIAQLLEVNQQELEVVSNRIDQFRLSIDAGVKVEEKLVGDETNDEEHPDEDVYQKTHQEITRIDNQLVLLDKLWYIRGYLAEVDTYLALSDVVEDVDQYRAVKGTVSKMTETVQELPPCLIKQELHLMCLDYDKKIDHKIRALFFPLEGIYRVLKPVDAKIMNTWDELLSKIISGKVDATFDGERGVLTAVPTLDDKYVDSLVAFMMFVDASLSDKNKFRSKINHSMVNYLSLHITKLPNLANLRQICESWNIKISDLDELYYNWQTDQYINRVRKIFASTEFTEWVNDLSDANSNNGDEPNVSVNQNNDWDNWDDGWDDDDDDEKAAKPPVDNDNDNDNDKPKVMVSQVAHKLVEAIIDFNNPNILDSVKALGVILYPSLSDSFVMSNDFHYIAEQLQASTLAKFVDNYWNQQLAALDTEILGLVRDLGINGNQLTSTGNPNIKDDDYDSSDDGTLDDATIAKLSKLHQKLQSISNSQLHYTNSEKYGVLVGHIAKVINTFLIHSIYLLEDISQVQAVRIGHLIDACNNITVPFVGSKPEDLLFHKLENVQFIVGGHLNQILDRFYQGEFYDLDTEEITALIESTFSPSELRDRSVKEITDFRSM